MVDKSTKWLARLALSAVHLGEHPTGGVLRIFFPSTSACCCAAACVMVYKLSHVIPGMDEFIYNFSISFWNVLERQGPSLGVTV